MTKKSLFFLAMMLPAIWSMASCNAIGRKKQPVVSIPKPDSVVYASLGKTMSDVLLNPTKVTCYRLKGVDKVDSNTLQVEPHWIRDTLLGELAPQVYGVLQFALIANQENYRNDSVRVKAPYIPMMEFEFRQKKIVVHVLVSTSDFSWTIMYDDKRQLHFNYTDRELMERFCDMFISNNN